MPHTPAAEPNLHAEDVRALTAAIEGEFRPGLHDRMLYATDASLYQVEPLGVLIPADVEDVVRAVRVCKARNLPMLPRGGGTSLAGQCTNRAVVFDLSSRCHRLLSVDVERRRCRVEPGITIDDLNERLRPTGLFFAPDPATSRHANIGGCIGNNAAGARSIRYGRTSESLIGLDVCLADGTRLTLEPGAARRDARVRDLTLRVCEVVARHARLIRERFPKTVRRNAGYALDLVLAQLDAAGGDPLEVNLAPLLCGSEGTLAVTLGAELALHRVPAARGLAVAAFPTLDDAMDALLPILALGPTAVELLDDLVISLARAQTEYRHYVDLLPHPGGQSPNAVLYVEFSAAHDTSEIAESFDRLRTMLPADRLACHTEAAAMLDAWKLRKAGEPLLHGVPGDRKPITFVEDNAVPPERLAEFVRRFRAIVAEHGTTAAFYAHASVGVLHVRPLLDIKDAADRAAMQSIAVEVADLAKELGGVMSGEHGDGRVRGPLLERFFGSELMAAFGQIKSIFDPAHLLNPGNIVSPGPIASMAASLRVEPRGAPVRVAEVETFYDYADQHGFAHAVEMCNGAGVCRKKSGGTMCPSYMALLDERHATRGRANALRLAMTGQMTPDGSPALNDAQTMATLDLCLSCKACKTECPSNVDVARLKAEYLALSDRAAGRVPLARRAVGSVHLLNRIASLTPGLVNALNGSRLGKAMLSAVLGVDPRRTMPAFAEPLRRQWKRDCALAPDPAASAPRVMLLADTFTAFNEPHIALAARRVLTTLGYRVELFLGSDFGRAAISAGLLPAAIDDAASLLDRLEPLLTAADEPAFLTLEPSVHSAIIDDWLSLKIPRPLAARRVLASRTFAVEDFLETHWHDHPAEPVLSPLSADVLIHGHCHQKALTSTAPTARLAARLTTASVRVLDTGCCGMAGSFGYMKKRYDLSAAIANQSLLPALAAAPAALLMASGTSCRHQVRELAARTALHPVEVMASVVGVTDPI